MVEVFSPSYKRANSCITHKFLPDVRYVVGESEADEYRRVHDNLLIVPNDVQGSYPRVCNYILKLGKDKSIIIMDDDITSINRWQGGKAKRLSAEETMFFFTNAAIMTEEIGAHYFGLNINRDKQVYREYTPLSTTSYCGGPVQGFVNNDLLFDERMLLKEDYDMTLQQLNKYRVVLRFNAYFYVAKQSENKGGCASYRNIETEKRQLKALQNKWGEGIVKFDGANRSHNLKKKKKVIDYNPIIKPPIKGV